MSDSTSNGEELTKMKLGDLKKLCKKHNLPTTGTKVELISRLVENNSESFTILQPGDEDKLLGDVDDVEPTPISIPVTEKSDAPVSLDKTAPIKGVTVPTGSKRPAATALTVVAEPKSPIKPADTSPIKEQTVDEVDKKTDTEAVKSDADRLSARAARFGLSRPMGTLSDDKLAARARRFGLPVTETGSAQSGLRNQSAPVDADDAEKRRKRAERFGTIYADAIGEAERKARRLERFGATTESNQTEEEKLKTARAIKFGIQTDEETLMKRKARFGVT